MIYQAKSINHRSCPLDASSQVCCIEKTCFSVQRFEHSDDADECQALHAGTQPILGRTHYHINRAWRVRPALCVLFSHSVFTRVSLSYISSQNVEVPYSYNSEVWTWITILMTIDSTGGGAALSMTHDFIWTSAFWLEPTWYLPPSPWIKKNILLFKRWSTDQLISLNFWNQQTLKLFLV